MKNKLYLLIAIATILGCVDRVNASDTTDTGRVSAVVELTDGELQSLLQTGSFKMSIPHSLRNKVNSLILKRPDRFKDEVAVLFNDVDKRFDTVAISVDDSTIEQIAYQPVELKIYESGYSHIMVRYRRGNGTQAKKPSKTDSVEMKITLNNGKSITGRLSYMTQFPLESGLGKVKVKLEEVSQITFDEDGDLTVIMLNGDTLKGESNFSSLVVNSRWGQERLKTKDIASITPSLPDASPALSSLNGAVLPGAMITNGTIGQPQAFPGVMALPPAMNQTLYAQPMHQHQFPMETGRIDTVPRSPRVMQSHPTVQPMPMQSFYGNQGQLPNTLSPYAALPTPQPVQPYHVYNGYGQYSVPAHNGMPAHGGMTSGYLPQGSPLMNQVPISNQPVIDSLIGQPLPMMTPNQALENWLFPQD